MTRPGDRPVAPIRGLMLVALLVSAFTLSACAEDEPDRAAPPDTASEAPGRIGVFGGSLEVERVRLEVPLGALERTVDLRVMRSRRVAPSGFVVQSQVFDFEPDGLSFGRPVDVRIPFEGGSGLARLYWTTGDGERFAPVPSRVEDGFLVAEIEHFSSGFVGYELAGDPTLSADPCTAPDVVVPLESHAQDAQRGFTIAEDAGEVCVLASQQPEVQATVAIDDKPVIEPEPQPSVTATKRALPGQHELEVALGTSSDAVAIEGRFAKYDPKMTTGTYLVVHAPFASSDTVLPPDSVDFFAQGGLHEAPPRYELDPHEVIATWQVVDAETLQVVRTFVESHGAPPVDFSLKLFAHWDGTDEVGNVVPDGLYLYFVELELVRTLPSGSTKVVESLASPAREIIVGDAPPPAPETAEETLRRIVGTIVLLDEAFPPSLALALLPANVATAAKQHETAARQLFERARKRTEKLIQSTSSSSVARAQQLQLARDERHEALVEMEAIGALLYEYDFPRNGSVFTQPRYAVPIEALSHAQFLDAEVGEPIAQALASAAVPRRLSDIVAEVERPGMAIIGKREVVERLVLTEYLLVDGELEDVGVAVATGEGLRVVTDRPLLFQGAELLRDPVIYDATANPLFVPQLLANHNGFETLMQSVFGLDPPFETGPTLCQNCTTCCQREGCSPSLGFATHRLVRNLAYCPSDTDAIEAVPTDDSAVMRDLTGLDIATKWYASPLPALEIATKFQARHLGFDYVLPDMGGGLPGAPGGGNPCGGGGSPPVDDCAMACNVDCDYGQDDQPTPDPEIGDLQLSAQECTQVVNASSMVEGGVCDRTHCDFADPALELAFRRYGAASLDDQGDFLSPRCLEFFGGGGVPEECQPRGELRSAVSLIERACAVRPTLCQNGVLGQSTLLCTGTRASGPHCIRCDALGNCHQADVPPLVAQDAGDGDDGDGGSGGGDDGTDDDCPDSAVDCEVIDGHWVYYFVFDCTEAPAEVDCEDPTAGSGTGEVPQQASTPPPAGGPPDEEDDEDPGPAPPPPDPAGPFDDEYWERERRCMLTGQCDDAGSEDAPAEGGDPVNIATGAVFDRIIDLENGPASLQLELVRTYRSDARVASHLGRNWNITFVGERLITIDNNDIDYTFPQWCYLMQPEATCVLHHRGDAGSTLYMRDPSRGGLTFVPTVGGGGVVRAVTRPYGDGSDEAWFYALRDVSGFVTEFGPDGNVVRKIDPAGNELVYQYDAAGRLRRALDERGHGFEFEYGLWDLLIAVEEVGQPSRRVEYCYDLAVNPPAGTLHDAFAEIEAELGLSGPDAVPGCYRIVEALPDETYLKALAECAPGNSSSEFEACMAASPIVVSGTGLPPVLEADVRETMPREALRSLAFLGEVRVLPAASGVEDFTACVDPAVDAQITRYTYSRRPLDVDLQYAWTHTFPPHEQRRKASGFGTIGGCFEYEPVLSVIRLYDELDAMRGRVVRVERRLNAAEKTSGGAPAVASTAIGCTGAKCGERTQIVLETQYDWDPSSPSFGYARTQRFGSDVELTERELCRLDPVTADPEAFVTALPLVRFSYFTGRKFAMPPSGVPHADRVVMSEAYDTILRVGALESLEPDPTTADPDDGVPFLVYDHGEYGCAAIARANPEYKTDLLGRGTDDLTRLDQYEPIRLARNDAARRVCQVVLMRDRLGRAHITALNFMGRPLVELVEESGWPDAIGSTFHIVLRRYNGDGSLVERWEQPPLTSWTGPSTTVAGPRLHLVRDETNSNPLARSNVLVRELFGSAAHASGLEAFPGTPAQAVSQRERTEIVWEPLTNQPARIDRIGSQGEVRSTTRFFEYQLPGGEFLLAAAQYGWWELSPDPLAVMGTMLTLDDPAPIVGLRPPSTQTGSGRPLHIGTLEPEHFSDASFAPRRRAHAMVRDGFGQVVTTYDSAGLVVNYDYAPRQANSGIDPTTLAVEDRFTLGPVVSGDRLAEGGPLREITVERFTPSNLAGFPGEGLVDTSVTTYTLEGALGRVSAVTWPNGEVSALVYDGHHRLHTVQTPDGGLFELEFDGAGRAITQTWSGDAVAPIREEVYRDPAGDVVAVALASGQEKPGDDIRHALADLVERRELGDRSLAELTTFERDAEGRLALLTSPERRALLYEQHPWAGPERVAAFDLAAGSLTPLQVTELSFDRVGRVLREEIVGANESLVVERAFDPLGRLLAEREPNGMVSALVRNGLGELVAEYTVDLAGVVQHRIEVERDGAGLVREVSEAWLRDANDAAQGETMLTSSVLRDDEGRVQCVASPDGLAQHFEYASDDRVSAVTLRNHELAASACSGVGGTILERTYERLSIGTSTFASRTIHGAGSSELRTDVELDWDGKPLRVLEDRAGSLAEQRFVYDGLGRVAATFDEWSTGTRYEFDATGRLRGVFQHRVLGASDGGDLVTQYEYDADGLLSAVIDPAQGTSHFTYDALGRVVRQSLPGPAAQPIVHETRYDELGRIERASSGGVLQTRGNAGAPGTVTEYAYLPGTTLIAQATVGSQVTTSYGWSAQNTLETLRRLDGGHDVLTSRAFDGAGRVRAESTTIDGMTYRVDFDYDASAGRLSQVLSADEAGGIDPVALRPAYHGTLLDGIGARTRNTTPFRVELEHTGFVATEHQVFEASGGASTAAWLTHQLSLDGVGRPSRRFWRHGDEQGTALGLEERYYGRDNRLLASVVALGQHGRVRVPEYDGLNRLVGLRQSSTTDASELAAWRFFLAQPSNRRVLETSPLGRELLSSGFGGTWSDFERSPLGTPELEAQNGTPVWSAQLQAERSIQAVDSPLTGGHANLTWDSPRGLLMKAGTLELEWTADELLASTQVQRSVLGSRAQSLTESYVYDGFSRIVRVIRDGHTLDRVWAGSEVLREVTMCGERVWWPSGSLDRPMAYSLEWDPACNVQSLGAADFAAQLGLLDVSATNLTSEMQQPGGQVIGVLQDLHGDVVGLVDAQGTLLETYEYDVHGSRTLRDPATGAVVASSVLGAPAVSRWGNPLGYTGRPLSSVSGLYDLRARHYSAELRIFTAPDPLGYVDSFDLWQYTAADPLNYVDPFGLAMTRDDEEREERARQELFGDGLAICGGRPLAARVNCAERYRDRLTDSFGSADEAVRKKRERQREDEEERRRLRELPLSPPPDLPDEPEEPEVPGESPPISQCPPFVCGSGQDDVDEIQEDREEPAESRRELISGMVGEGIEGYLDPTSAIVGGAGSVLKMIRAFKTLKWQGAIRRRSTVRRAADDTDDAGDDPLDPLDPKAGRRFKRTQDAIDQLDGISKKQGMLRTGKTSNVIIDSKQKSKQRAKNSTSRIKSLKDALDEFD